MVTLTVTVTFSYEANPVHYGTTNPVEMAAIDRGNFEDGPGSLLEVLQDAEYEINVVPSPPKEED